MRKVAQFIVASVLLVLTGCSAPNQLGGPTGSVGRADHSLPPTVEKALADYLAICTENGGDADSTQGVLRRDLNGDAITDYVLDGHLIYCAGAASVWGDRAKMVSVFIGNDVGDATLAFSDLTWGASFEGKGRNTRLWLGVSAAACGKPPAQDFASENFCDRAIIWNAASRSFDYAPVSTVRHMK